MTYKPFEDDESDTAGYQEAEAYALLLQEQAITDIKSAAGHHSFYFSDCTAVLTVPHDFGSKNTQIVFLFNNTREKL